MADADEDEDECYNRNPSSDRQCVSTYALARENFEVAGRRTGTGTRTAATVAISL